MASDSALTFDIDWNPDWVIRDTIELCDKLGVPATFFVTHDCQSMRDLVGTHHERGIHPNFNPGSTQGGSPEEILTHVAALVPDAVSFRSHSLTSSSPLLTLIGRQHPNIRIESNTFLPYHPNLQPTRSYYPGSKLPFFKLPFFFEDDLFCDDPDWRWSNLLPASAGLKIFTFHPLLVYLNAPSLDSYSELRKRLGGRPLIESKPDDFAGLRNEVGPGIRDFLIASVDHIGRDRFATLATIAEPWISANGKRS